MSSPYYTKLTSVARLSYDDIDAEKVTAALSDIEEVRRGLSTFRNNPGMAGEAANAALAWVAEFQEQLEAKDAELKTMLDRHELAREAMRNAKTQHGQLSASLQAPNDDLILPNGPYTVEGVELSGHQYLTHLRNERNAEREAAAKKILDEMNIAVGNEADNINTPIPAQGGSGPSGGGTSGSRSGGGAGSPVSPGGVTPVSPRANVSVLGPGQVGTLQQVGITDPHEFVVRPDRWMEAKFPPRLQQTRSRTMRCSSKRTTLPTRAQQTNWCQST